jgi:hypothetical protein
MVAKYIFEKLFVEKRIIFLVFCADYIRVICLASIPYKTLKNRINHPDILPDNPLY